MDDTASEERRPLLFAGHNSCPVVASDAPPAYSSTDNQGNTSCGKCRFCICILHRQRTNRRSGCGMRALFPWVPGDSKPSQEPFCHYLNSANYHKSREIVISLHFGMWISYSSR